MPSQTDKQVSYYRSLALYMVLTIIAVSFVLGASASALAGYVGMRVATLANVRTTHAAKQGLAPALDVAFGGGEDLSGGFLASLHPRLVVSIDVHQFAIEAHGPLKQGDQGPKTACIELTQGEGHALAPPFTEG